MDALDWRFPTILVGAMLTGIFLTWVQLRSYNAELAKAARSARGEQFMLVSGRGRSIAGGAIVIAVVDTAARQIIWARALAGRSVLARFHDAPALLGAVDGAADRARGRQLRAALEMALAQLGTRGPGAPGPASPTDHASAPRPRPLRRRAPENTALGAPGARGARHLKGN